jgi:hypothetical protein
MVNEGTTVPKLPRTGTGLPPFVNGAPMRFGRPGGVLGLGEEFADHANIDGHFRRCHGSGKSRFAAGTGSARGSCAALGGTGSTGADPRCPDRLCLPVRGERTAIRRLPAQRPQRPSRCPIPDPSAAIPLGRERTGSPESSRARLRPMNGHGRDFSRLAVLSTRHRSMGPPKSRIFPMSAPFVRYQPERVLVAACMFDAPTHPAEAAAFEEAEGLPLNA